METAPQLGGFFHAQVGVADCEAAVIVDSTRAAGSGIRAGNATVISRLSAVQELALLGSQAGIKF